MQEGSAVTGDLYDPHQQTFDQPGNAIAPRRMLWEVRLIANICQILDLCYFDSNANYDMRTDLRSIRGGSVLLLLVKLLSQNSTRRDVAVFPSITLVSLLQLFRLNFVFMENSFTIEFSKKYLHMHGLQTCTAFRPTT